MSTRYLIPFSYVFPYNITAYIYSSLYIKTSRFVISLQLFVARLAVCMRVLILDNSLDSDLRRRFSLLRLFLFACLYISYLTLGIDKYQNVMDYHVCSVSNTSWNLRDQSIKVPLLSTPVVLPDSQIEVL